MHSSLKTVCIKQKLLKRLWKLSKAYWKMSVIYSSVVNEELISYAISIRQLLSLINKIVREFMRLILPLIFLNLDSEACSRILRLHRLKNPFSELPSCICFFSVSTLPLVFKRLPVIEECLITSPNFSQALRNLLFDLF